MRDGDRFDGVVVRLVELVKRSGFLRRIRQIPDHDTRGIDSGRDLVGSVCRRLRFGGRDRGVNQRQNDRAK